MISYRQVSLDEGRPIIEAVLAEQWAETGDDLPCEPNWRLYASLDKIGNGKLVVAYEDARPVGYGTMVIHPHVNSGHVMVATISTYYVEPRASRGLILKSLFEALISLLPPNVARVFIDTEARHSAGRILEAMGFHPVKIGYRLDRRA